MEYENSFRETVKSVVAADAYRVKGNDFYKQRKFHEALIEYNKSICCAPPQSKELGLAYANRSAIYSEVRMYRKCIENIKLARESHYPAEKMKVVNDREEKCVKLIKPGLRDIEFNVWDFFKLSFKANKKIPFIIDGLELAESEKYGRMIVTTRDLKAGNIIAIEEPCFKVLDEVALKYRCSFCLKNNEYSLIPCEKCPKVMYCTNDCREKDFQAHETECLKPGIASQLTLIHKMVLAAVRILKSESAIPINEREQKTVFDFDLSNAEAADYEKTLLEIVSTLSTTGTTYASNNPAMRVFDKFHGIASCNSFELGEFSYEKHADGKFRCNFFKQFGTGLFAFSSLFNHSCFPNVHHVMVEGKMVFYVTHPIKAGEQLFATYGPAYAINDISKRKSQLQVYEFSCDCIACANNYPILTELPRKHRKFFPPKMLTATKNAIAQFRKNCDYVNKHWALPPSYEVASLEEHNYLLLKAIARRTLNDTEIELANFLPSYM